MSSWCKLALLDTECPGNRTVTTIETGKCFPAGHY